ncbi:hypothetical protein ACNRWW_20810 [Metabacillus sp. HB246100]
MKNNQKKWNPYFDPYIFQKVLEDVYLPPIAREILKPRSLTHKHNFLFPKVKERFLPEIERRVKLIDSIVKEETIYQFYEYEKYLNHTEEDKQWWFNDLREHYKLPSDYDFEK